MNAIINSLETGTLDYNWIARYCLSTNKISSEDKEDFELIKKIANNSFDYIKKYYRNIQNDKSLKVIVSMCTCDSLVKNINTTDKEVYFLSNLFNQIIKSTRKLHKCYDCGTNARALFLKLIENNRFNSNSNSNSNKLFLTPKEQNRMRLEYSPRRDNGRFIELENFKHKLLDVNSPTVFICSIGINMLGHVWIIEKTFTDTGKERFHHYQSALKSHLMIDFLKEQNYGRYPDRSLDVIFFVDSLYQILRSEGVWTKETYDIFNDLFHFKIRPVTTTNLSFCWTYITY